MNFECIEVLYHYFFELEFKDFGNLRIPISCTFFFIYKKKSTSHQHQEPVATFSTFSCNCVYVRYHTDFNHFLIAGPPRAEINSMQEKVNLGQNIKLNCPITGIPTPLYEWYKASKLCNLNKNKRYSLIFFHVSQIIFHYYN